MASLRAWELDDSWVHLMEGGWIAQTIDIELPGEIPWKWSLMQSLWPDLECMNIGRGFVGIEGCLLNE